MPVAMLLVTLLLLLAAAALSALESALVVLREKPRPVSARSELESTAQERALQDPASILPDVFLHSSLLNLLLTTAGLTLILLMWPHLGWNPWIGGAGILMTGLILVELIPRLLALRLPASAVRWTFPTYQIIRRIAASVIVPMLNFAVRLSSGPAFKKLKTSSAMSSQEIETLIDMREEQQVINADESALLRGVVNLCSLTVKDVMTPRVDLPLMPHDAEDSEAVNMLETARQRFVAVYDMKLDAIAYLIDAQRWKLTGRPHWSTVTQEPVFAPETQSLLEVWRQHLPNDACAVVVVDEFGGFEGLLSLSNIQELLFSKAAPSQYASASVQAIGINRYLVAGSTRLEEIERELDVTLELEGVDTIGGLVMNQFGYPPKPGEQLIFGGLNIKVKRTLRARVQQLELRVLDEEEEKPS